MPFKTNSYVINELIDWNNIPEDPIFNLNFPRREMLLRKHYNLMKKTLDSNASNEEIAQVVKKIRSELNPNSSGQEYNIPVVDGIQLKGVQHKYRETVLFFPSQGQTCHAYCTFCFRWPQFSGMHNFKFAMKESELLIKYLTNHQ